MEFYTLDEVLVLLQKHNLKENYLDSLMRREKAIPYYFYEGFLKSSEGCLDTELITLTMHFSGYLCPARIPKRRLRLLKDPKKAFNYIRESCSIGKTETIELDDICVTGQYVSYHSDYMDQEYIDYVNSFVTEDSIHGNFNIDYSLGGFYREIVYFNKSKIDELVFNEISLLNNRLTNIDINSTDKNSDKNEREIIHLEELNKIDKVLGKNSNVKAMSPMAFKGVSKIFNGLFAVAKKHKIPIDESKYALSDELTEIAIAMLVGQLILEALPLHKIKNGLDTHGLITLVKNEADVSQETASKWIKLAQQAKKEQ